MSETTDTQPEGNDPTEQPDAPTVVDEPEDQAPTLEEFDKLVQRVRELEERATAPDTSEPAPAAKDRFVEWDDHDEWGNPRVFFGVDLGEAPYDPGKRNVARLVTRVDGYDPAILRPLES